MKKIHHHFTCCSYAAGYWCIIELQDTTSAYQLTVLGEFLPCRQFVSFARLNAKGSLQLNSRVSNIESNVSQNVGLEVYKDILLESFQFLVLPL